MSGRIKGSLWLVPALVFAFVVVPAGVARAQCAEELSIEEAIAGAETVFVGTVAELDYQGRVATFRVEDVWKGEVGAIAVVNGVAGVSLTELEAARARGEDVMSSGERSYENGVRYLVVPFSRDGDALWDGSCSVTQPFTSAIAQRRPATAHVPQIGEDPATPPPTFGGDPRSGGDGGSSVWLVVVLMAGVIGVAAGLLTWRWRNHRPPLDTA